MRAKIKNIQPHLNKRYHKWLRHFIARSIWRWNVLAVLITTIRYSKLPGTVTEHVVSQATKIDLESHWVTRWPSHKIDLGCLDVLRLCIFSSVCSVRSRVLYMYIYIHVYIYVYVYVYVYIYIYTYIYIYIYIFIYMYPSVCAYF